MGVPLYQLFYEGEHPPPTPHLTRRPTLWELAQEPGVEQAEARFLFKIGKLATQLKKSDRSLLLDLAAKLAGRSKKKTKTPL